jgi:hypothetical protein
MVFSQLERVHLDLQETGYPLLSANLRYSSAVSISGVQYCALKSKLKSPPGYVPILMRNTGPPKLKRLKSTANLQKGEALQPIPALFRGMC